MMQLREGMVRSIQFFLGLDGILHVAEVISALNEGAAMTATLTGIHACIFFAGVYFVGHDHSHHRG